MRAGTKLLVLAVITAQIGLAAGVVQGGPFGPSLPPFLFSPKIFCPHIGTSLVPAKVIASGEQRCPAFRVGPGIPFVGQLKLFGIGRRRCPLVETLVPAHTEAVVKQGFFVSRGDQVEVRMREVRCGDDSNAFVIGVSNCHREPWRGTGTKLTNLVEHPCITE